MNEHPILFKTDMIQAIRDNRKTVTRRVIRNPGRLNNLMLEGEEAQWCPYGGSGDLLWVRETWLLSIDGTGLPSPHDIYIEYRAEDNNWRPHSPKHIGLSVIRHAPAHIETARKLEERHACQAKLAGHPLQYSWRPSIHMPKWAARLWLEIVDIRAERLQDITEEDVGREGIDTNGCCLCPPEMSQGVRFCINCNERLYDLVGEFQDLWDSINEKRGYPWSANPWVWRIQFFSAFPAFSAVKNKESD